MIRHLRNFWPLVLLWTFIVVAVVLTACKRSPAPPPATKVQPVALFVGGLGHAQLGDIEAALAAARPDVLVVDFGANNAWMNSPADWANANPHGKLVLVAHSFGADTAMRDAARIGDVACAVLLEPVRHAPADSDIRIPSKIPKCYVYRASEPTVGITPAWLHGHFENFEADGAHSQICHAPEVVADVVKEISEALQ